MSEITETMVEAGARAIAQNVNSPKCIQFDNCPAGKCCVCRGDARLAITAASLSQPVGYAQGWNEAIAEAVKVVEAAKTKKPSFVRSANDRQAVVLDWASKRIRSLFNGQKFSDGP